MHHAGYEEGGGGMNDLRNILTDELAAHCDSIDRLWAVVSVMVDGLEENAEPEIMEKVFWHILNCLQDLKSEAQDICGEITRSLIREKTA